MMELKITLSLSHNCFTSHLYCGLFKLCFLLVNTKNKIPNWLPSAHHTCFCLYSCYLISLPLTDQRDDALSNKNILIVIQCPNYLLCSDIFCCVDRSYTVILLLNCDPESLSEIYISTFPEDTLVCVCVNVYIFV